MKKIVITIFGFIIMMWAGSIWAQEAPSLLPDPSIEGYKVEYLTGNSANRDAMVGYMVNLRSPNTGFYSFPVPAFTPFSLVGIPDIAGAYAADFGPGGVLYAIKDFIVDTLYTVNKLTGAFTKVVEVTGTVNETIPTGMAYHEATSTMYLSYQTRLYTLNLTTGVATLVGTINPNWLIIEIAVNCEGALYGIDILNDVLVSINTTTGAGTVIGPVNYSANFAQGLDFDNNTGTLYWAAYQGSGVSGIRTVDLATGNSTEVAPTTGFEVDCFVIEGTCVNENVIPVSDWAVVIGIILIVFLAVIRFRRAL